MSVLQLDPNSVQAGVLPLLIVIGLAVIMALGFLSMRRHIRRIQAPTAAELTSAETMVASPSHDQTPAG